jgi:hypothetical protein
MNSFPVAALLVFFASTSSTASGQTPAVATVKVTHSHLMPACLDGAPATDRRTWTLREGSHTMAFTMRNEPRPGTSVESPDSPGVAVVTFTVEAGHKYEVEVRAPAASFSKRVWEREQWTPAVRDRTVDRIVSGDASWTTSACQPR